MENTQQLSIALKEIQSQVIGLFRPRYYPNDQYIPVIADSNSVLTCIEIGTLLGLQTLTIGAESGRYVKFPDIYLYNDEGMQSKKKVKQTLSDMIKDPIAFHSWYKTNIHSGN